MKEDTIAKYIAWRDSILLAGDDIDADAALELCRVSSGREPSGKHKRRIALAAAHKARLGLAHVSKSQKYASIAWLVLNGFNLPPWWMGDDTK